MHLVGNVTEDVVKELDGALAGGHTKDETEVDVLALVGNILVAEELDDLEELPQVEILSGGDDVDHLVEVILLVTAEELRDITGEVEGGAIPLPDERLLETLALLAGNELGEVNELGALVLLADLLVLHELANLVHGILGDLGFAGVLVEVDVEAGVGVLVTNNGEITEALPHGEGIGVAVGHLLEVAAGLLVQAVGLEGRNILAGLLALGELLLLGGHLGVDADVELEEVVDGVLLEGLLVAVLLVGEGQETVLLTPVAEVVDADDIPAGAGVEVGEETTDDGGTEMASVEGLSNVGGGELDDDALLALAGVLGVLETVGLVETVLGALGVDQGNDGVDEGRGLDEEAEMDLADGGLGEEGIGVGELWSRERVLAGVAKRKRNVNHRIAYLDNMYLGSPLLGELVRLLALYPEGGDGEGHVALLETGSPSQVGVDERSVDARDLGENVGQMGAVEVHKVQLGVVLGELGLDGVEAEAVDLLDQLVNGSGGGHCAVFALEQEW